MADVQECPHCGEPLPAAAVDASDSPLTLNGETFEVGKLSFLERHTIARLVREIVLFLDPEANPEEDDSGDTWRVAFAIVVARRTNPEFSIEDGLALTPDELRAAPPTQAVKRRAKA